MKLIVATDDSRMLPPQSNSLGGLRPKATVHHHHGSRFFLLRNAVQEGCMQHGCMERLNRKRGPEVWQFRWSVTGADGKRLYRKKIVGTVERYPDENNKAVTVAPFARANSPKLMKRVVSQESRITSIGMDIEADACS